MNGYLIKIEETFELGNQEDRPYIERFTEDFDEVIRKVVQQQINAVTQSDDYQEEVGLDMDEFVLNLAIAKVKNELKINNDKSEWAVSVLSCVEYALDEVHPDKSDGHILKNYASERIYLYHIPIS